MFTFSFMWIYSLALIGEFRAGAPSDPLVCNIYNRRTVKIVNTICLLDTFCTANASACDSSANISGYLRCTGPMNIMSRNKLRPRTPATRGGLTRLGPEILKNLPINLL